MVRDDGPPKGRPSVEAVTASFDGVKEVFASILQRQTEQKAQVVALKQAAALQDEKLSALQKEMQALKQLMAAKKTAAAQSRQRTTAAADTAASARCMADDRTLRGASSLLPKASEKAAQVQVVTAAEPKKVYSNRGLTFSREFLLSMIDEPQDTVDHRMIPCLEELGRELGRPARVEPTLALRIAQLQKSKCVLIFLRLKPENAVLTTIPFPLILPP